MNPSPSSAQSTTNRWRVSPDELIERFLGVRSQTERLAAPLSPADQTVQSMPDCSPTKWHRAHITWFFETFLLGPHKDGYQPFDADYNYLFNSYYDAVGERHPRAARGMITRPSADEITEYRKAVDDAVVELLSGADHDTFEQLTEMVELGIHHEQQHQELLLMDIKHLLSLNPTQPTYRQRDPQPSIDVGQLGWVHFEAATARIGREADDREFAFDNELPAHDQLVGPYALADRLVTAGEWLEFMADDGYHRPDLWLSDGWHTSQAQGWQAPLYWSPTQRGWEMFSLSGARSIDPSEPVCHLSFYEADAYARWADARLPTEAEWEHAARGQRPDGVFAGAEIFHPTPAQPLGEQSSAQLRQMFGDCWEWTGSPYRPYPGYRTPEGAVGEYNGKFMINTMVLRGGCAFTPDQHIRSTYRNFFHPHTRWHLSGLRLAKDLD